MGGHLGKTVGGTTDVEEGMVSRTWDVLQADYVRGIQLPVLDLLSRRGVTPLYGIGLPGSCYGTSISRYRITKADRSLTKTADWIAYKTK